MNKIIILTDSGADLSPEIIAKYNIVVLPLLVSINEKTYRDGVDIDALQLFEKVQEEKTMAKTAAVAPAVFYEAFNKYVTEGYDVIYCGLGANISSSNRNAASIISYFPENRVFVVDSQNLSTGVGLLLLKACQMRDAGMSASDIAQKMADLTKHVKTQFVVESLEYLHKGGRCSGTTRIIGAVLRIKPMILVRNGMLVVGKSTIGFMKKALDLMFKMFIRDLPNVDQDFVFITQTAADKSTKYLTSRYAKYGQDNNIKMPTLLQTSAGSVISSHCGPGSIGILYLVKDVVTEKAEELNENE